MGPGPGSHQKQGLQKPVAEGPHSILDTLYHSGAEEVTPSVTGEQPHTSPEAQLGPLTLTQAPQEPS